MSKVFNHKDSHGRSRLSGTRLNANISVSWKRCEAKDSVTRYKNSSLSLTPIGLKARVSNPLLLNR